MPTMHLGFSEPLGVIPNCLECQALPCPFQLISGHLSIDYIEIAVLVLRIDRLASG